MSARRLVACALIALAIAMHAYPSMAAARAETDEARVLRYKSIQRDRLMRGVHARAERYQSRIRTVGDPTATGFRRRVPRDLTEAGGPQGVEASRLETSADHRRKSSRSPCELSDDDIRSMPEPNEVESRGERAPDMHVCGV